MFPSYLVTGILKYWGGKLPVQPAVLARALGVTIEGAPELAPLSASFKRTAAGPVIEYAPGEGRLRQRFAIAHALGHFALKHQGDFRDSASNFSSSVSDSKERAANRFALELLIPEPALKHLVQAREVFDVSRLAEAFQVSEVAVRERLRQLDYIS